MDNTHIIIQARMNASRLPKKILMPFAGEYTFLEWMVERAKLSQKADKVIVATTVNPQDDATAALCEKRGYDFFRGSEDDVLQRYHETAKKFGSEIIVRITADNPLVDISETDRLIGVLTTEKLDYATNHGAGLPLGTGSEVFTAAALERAVTEAKDPYEHEHVTPYFYRHPELFKQRVVQPLSIHPFASEARLTLDTPQDADFLHALARAMAFSEPLLQSSTSEILTCLASRPDITGINAGVTQKTFPKA